MVFGVYPISGKRGVVCIPFFLCSETTVNTGKVNFFHKMFANTNLIYVYLNMSNKQKHEKMKFNSNEAQMIVNMLMKRKRMLTGELNNARLDSHNMPTSGIKITPSHEIIAKCEEDLKTIDSVLTKLMINDFVN